METIAKSLERFLPLTLLGRLHGSHGERPSAVTFPAAVIFVDVSRYTALVEQLARRGQEGLVQIPKLLSLSYARCADHVCDRGGEVVCFAGDSLLAYWPAGEAGLGNAVKCAAECAEAICRESRDRRDPGQGEIGPALHIGVGAGQLWAAAVGGAPVWNLVAGGDAVIQAARSQALARRWEVVLSEDAAKALRGDGENALMPPVAPSGPTIASEWLVEFLPLQLQELLLAPQSAPAAGPAVNSAERDRRRDARFDTLAEIRPVSVLFARIIGIGHRDPDALARHHSLCAELQRISRRCGGPAGELLFDDKGLVYICVFGTRGTFHRDDPARAVEAARAISRQAEEMGLSVSVGVATGEALFRVVGGARRQQLMVLGTPLNRAARLVTTVSDDVLCDAPTERASRTSFDFERRGTLQLAGLGDVAPVFRPLEPRSRPLPAAALIGRERELAFLQKAFDETRDGSSGLVALLGEPGIGKSRLVATFTDNLRAVGVAVSVVPAERDDRRSSLLAWRRVLESLLGLPSESDGLVLLESIAARVRSVPWIADRLPLLNDLLAVEIQQSEGTRHLDGAHRADATMRLLGDILGVLAPRPFALVLEDSQWLDSASWRLVEWVLGSLPSLLLVLCIRSEEVPAEWKHLRRRAEAARINETDMDNPARRCRMLELEELSDSAVCELVSRTLGDVSPQEELARRIAVLAGGNPFFAEEIAHTLKSEGLIAVRDGLWRSIRPLDDLQYFEGVERVIRERVDRLDATSQDVIKAAAVIGRSFTFVELEALLKDELDAESLRSAVEALVDAHLVRRLDQPGSYEFRHDQTRDVVYGSMPGDLRGRLHANLAQWLERSRIEAMGGDLAVLVRHFEAADNKEKVVKYADLAAARALQIGAFREVESFLGICMTHEAKPQDWTPEQRLQAVRWRRKLAEAHYSRGDIHAQGVAVRKALKAAGQPVPVSPSVTLLRLAARGMRLALQQVLPASAKIIRREDLRSWEREMARCLNQAAMVDYFELRFTRGMCNLLGAVARAERTGQTTEMAVAASQLGCGLGMMGWRRACRYFMERAERIAVELADTAIHSHVCNLDALWQLGRGEWPGVDARLEQAQQLCLRSGDQLRWCNAQGMRFWSLYYRGEQAALEPTTTALLSRAQNAGNIQQEIWALRCKALCVLHTDQPREAVDILRLITSAMLGSVDLAAQISAKGALALALARTGRHAESVQAAAETLQLLKAMRRPSSHSTLVGISGAAEVFLRGREAGLSHAYEDWPQWEGQALRELDRYARIFPIGAPQFALWSGVSLWLDGKEARAMSVWKDGMAAAQHLSLRRDEALIAAELRRRRDRL
ncbi:AAA family ATPase [Sinorhizobium arboris]|uniref:AAA family ATPase n=1 Tax=Sinorhizobium arboris TaxID=76745 RepID=UPI00041A2995|nr:adenylate/guanylate cyclase domain-containing protein [Sinorhizobium arboris]